MEVTDLMERARDAIAVKRVYGEPYETGGVIMIPAAAVIGGGGGGGANEGKIEEKEIGGGFGFGARPVGAFVIKGSEVTWQPAPDWNRIVMGMQLVFLAGVLAVSSLLRARQRITAWPRRSFWARRFR